ncbi:hypothetical protein BDR26DRAFT_934334 [Obelidium mucronatum]|nr:hypothetical protein BDR26DRAFT_934334 [Obelidium mucronatum]
MTAALLHFGVVFVRYQLALEDKVLKLSFELKSAQSKLLAKANTINFCLSRVRVLREKKQKDKQNFLKLVSTRRRLGEKLVAMTRKLMVLAGSDLGLTLAKITINRLTKNASQMDSRNKVTEEALMVATKEVAALNENLLVEIQSGSVLKSKFVDFTAKSQAEALLVQTSLQKNSSTLHLKLDTLKMRLRGYLESLDPLASAPLLTSPAFALATCEQLKETASLQQVLPYPDVISPAAFEAIETSNAYVPCPALMASQPIKLNLNSKISSLQQELSQPNGISPATSETTDASVASLPCPNFAPSLPSSLSPNVRQLSREFSCLTISHKRRVASRATRLAAKTAASDKASMISTSCIQMNCGSVAGSDTASFQVQLQTLSGKRQSSGDISPADVLDEPPARNLFRKRYTETIITETVNSNSNIAAPPSVCLRRKIAYPRSSKLLLDARSGVTPLPLQPNEISDNATEPDSSSARVELIYSAALAAETALVEFSEHFSRTGHASEIHMLGLSGNVVGGDPFAFLSEYGVVASVSTNPQSSLETPAAWAQFDSMFPSQEPPLGLYGAVGVGGLNANEQEQYFTMEEIEALP